MAADPFSHSLFSAQLSFTKLLWTQPRVYGGFILWELLLTTELATTNYFKWYYKRIAMFLYIVLWKTDPAKMSQF